MWQAVVGGTSTSLRTRFNNYKSSSRKFSNGMSNEQAEIFRHFAEANHNGFFKDVTILIITVVGESRLREGLWQFKLNIFMPEGLYVRFVDHY